MLDLYLEPYVEPFNFSLDVEPWSETFMRNLYAEIFMWSFYPEPSWQTFLRKCGTFMWNVGKPELLIGTFRRNLGEPGSRFRVAAPNHPEALLEEPQAFQAVGELRSLEKNKNIPKRSCCKAQVLENRLKFAKPSHKNHQTHEGLKSLRLNHMGDANPPFGPQPGTIFRKAGLPNRLLVPHGLLFDPLNGLAFAEETHKKNKNVEQWEDQTLTKTKNLSKSKATPSEGETFRRHPESLWERPQERSQLSSRANSCESASIGVCTAGRRPNKQSVPQRLGQNGNEAPHALVQICSNLQDLGKRTHVTASQFYGLIFCRIITSSNWSDRILQPEVHEIQRSLGFQLTALSSSKHKNFHRRWAPSAPWFLRL